MIVLLVIVLVYIAINYVTADFMREVSYLKGYDDNAHAFWLVFFLGIVGCLYVVALPDLNVRKQNEKIIELLGHYGHNEESEEGLPVLNEKTTESVNHKGEPEEFEEFDEELPEL